MFLVLYNVQYKKQCFRLTTVCGKYVKDWLTIDLVHDTIHLSIEKSVGQVKSQTVVKIQQDA